MRKFHPLISGTIILTLTGFLSRFIGFFYRAFLSQTFGAEGMGIYQLIGPILALSYSFSAAGFQTAISKQVARETTCHDYSHSFQTVLITMYLSLGCSALSGYMIYQNATFIASEILLEPRCASLLRILAISIPFGSIHACINGYFYGIKKTKIPAFTQIVEQLVRVGSVFILYQYVISQGNLPTINFAIIGTIFGEITSMLISLYCIYRRFYKLQCHSLFPKKEDYMFISQKILTLSLPLSANRITINLLQSAEAIYIPNRLQAFGLTASDAMGTYGILMGMALPMILFPCALTNSISVLLLPLVSEAESNNQYQLIKKVIIHAIKYGTLFGLLCNFAFFIIGPYAGNLLFHNETAGEFIRILSFICPFLYLTSTLSSVLNGLGKTMYTFAFNIIGLSIRLCFIIILIPQIGIIGYLYGLLVSQLCITFLEIFALRKYLK